MSCSEQSDSQETASSRTSYGIGNDSTEMSIEKVSVIIPSRNVRGDLRSCLDALFENYGEGQIEVVVSDSNSSDGTVEMLSECFPAVKVSTSEERGSYASAVNRGVMTSRGEYLLFLDSDVIIGKETIGEMVTYLESHSDVGAVVSKMFYPDGTVQMMARRFPTVLNSLFGRETILTRLFPGNRISRRYLMLDELEGDEPFEVDWASSACLMVRKDVFESLEGFDEGFLFYWADADFCRRIQDNGFKICCLPSASVVHDMRNEATKKKSIHMIKSFHLGVYRYFRRYYIQSIFHPLNIVAIVGLSVRAAVQILANSLKTK